MRHEATHRNQPRSLTTLVTCILALSAASCIHPSITDYAEAKRIDTAQSYQDFRAKHPNNMVYDIDWRLAKRLNTIQEYQEFLRKYPNAAETNSAKAAIFKLEHDQK